MSLFTGRRRWSNAEYPWWVRHSLVTVLVVLMVLQTAHAIWSGDYVWVREQPLGDAARFGSEFWMWWSYEYNVSLVADTFGVLLLVVLGQVLYEDGANEGRDLPKTEE